MGKPHSERRTTLNLAAHRLRLKGRANSEIAEQIGVRFEQVMQVSRLRYRLQHLK